MSLPQFSKHLTAETETMGLSLLWSVPRASPAAPVTSLHNYAHLHVFPVI